MKKEKRLQYELAFKNKATLKHKGIYDYSLVEYITSKYKVKIICRIHGIFEQSPNSHLKGENCPKCASRIISFDKFLMLSQKIHNDKYDYSLVKYVNLKTKITITCPIHGEFQQTPSLHLKEKGCNKCAIQNRTKTKEQFIIDAVKVHNILYNYDKVEYVNNSTKIKILCNECNEFFYQAPDKHLFGRGCPKCNVSGWGYLEWVKSAERSKVFDSFKLYIIRCWNDTEEFYKIGKTYRKIHDRFISPKLPYEYEIIISIEDTGEDICKYEKILHALHRKYKYKPKINFMGRTECFSEIDNLFDLRIHPKAQSITKIVVDKIKEVVINN